MVMEKGIRARLMLLLELSNLPMSLQRGRKGADVFIPSELKRDCDSAIPTFSNEPEQHAKTSSFWQSFSSEDQIFRTVQLS